MSANYATLRPLILAKLETIEGIKSAFAVHTENTPGYPYVTFEPSAHGNVMYTTTDNLREYTFDVIIYQEMTKATRDGAMEILSATVDRVVDAFDSDTTFMQEGGADYTRPVPGQWGEYVSKAGPIKYAKLTLVIGVEIGVV